MSSILYWIIYIFLFLINPVLSIYFFIVKEKGVLLKVIFLLFISSLILFIKLKLGEGDDVHQYINAFNHYTSFDDIIRVGLVYLASIDIGFLYSSYIFKTIFDDPIVYLYIIYITNLTLLIFSYYKIDKKYFIYYFIIFLSTTIFYQTYSNAVRQSISISLSIWVYYFLMIKNSFKKALIIAFLASIFHSSAYILIGIILLSRLKLKLVLFLFYISFIFLFIDFGRIIAFVLPFDFIARKLTSYIENYQDYNYLTSLINLIAYIYILIIIFLVKVKRLSEKEKNFFKIYLLLVIILMIFSSSSVINARLVAYRVVMDPIIIFIIFNHLKNKKIILLNIFLLYLVLNLFYIETAVNFYLFDNKYDLLQLTFFDYIELINKKINLIKGLN